MGKGKIGGKYSGGSEATKRHPGYGEAGNKTQGIGSYSPEQLGFVGSGLTTFNFVDPNTGATITISAKNAKEAARIARTRGLKKKRKKR